MRRELTKAKFNFKGDIEILKRIMIRISGIIFIIGTQILFIVVSHEKITMSGCVIFLSQILIYFGNLNLEKFIGDKSNKYKNAALLFIAVTILYLVISRAFNIGCIFCPEFKTYFLSPIHLLVTGIQLLFVLIISFYIRLYEASIRQNVALVHAHKKTEDALEEKLRIECMMSQLQLSPHDLFNSLNYIRERIKNQDPEVSIVIENLSAILRHTLIDPAKVKKVLLFEEVTCIKSYLELQFRLNPSQHYISFSEDFKIDNEMYQIPPGILLTISNNLIKYGILDDPESPAEISVSVNRKELCFQTFNYKQGFCLPGRGIGISSVRKILNYFYPGKHSLLISDEDETYALTLKIDL